MAFNLFVAVAFPIMADPVSSVAYPLEAVLHARDGDVSLLVPTMTLVVATIALGATSYDDLIRRFPGARPAGGHRGRAALSRTGVPCVLREWRLLRRPSAVPGCVAFVELAFTAH